jgi:hypothetical protein
VDEWLGDDPVAEIALQKLQILLACTDTPAEAGDEFRVCDEKVLWKNGNKKGGAGRRMAPP